MLKFNLLHTFPAFTIKNYRTFFLSQWVALMGLWMQLTAQQWLVYEITDSPLLLGVLSTMQYMPSPFSHCGPVFGLIATKRKVFCWEHSLCICSRLFF